MTHPVDKVTVEWWNQSSRDTFIELYDKLISKGWSEDEAVELLTEAYNATAAEYGD